MTTSLPTPYPFSALVGQDQLRLALILCAVRPEIGGVLEFGTTVLSAADGSIAGLLGASPGA